MTKKNLSLICSLLIYLDAFQHMLKENNLSCRELWGLLETEEEDQDEKKILDFYEKDFKTA